MQLLNLENILNRFPGVKKTARQLVALLPLSIRFGREFWMWYTFFEESEGWSTAQLASYQMDLARKLLAELSQTSPFYRQRLSELEIETLSNMREFQERVPILTRKEFRENYALIRSSLSDKERSVPSRTSGTTGMALQFEHPVKDWAREWAAICHQWKRVGYVPGVSRRAEFRGLTTRGQLIEAFPDKNMIRCSILNLKKEAVQRYADEIRNQKINFLHGYPSAFYLLAKQIKDSGIDFPEPEAILLASEEVFDWQLLQIKEIFPNAKLHASYGCAERTVMAGWCEHRQEYHVLPQYSLVEVDETTNEIIGTNLFNTLNGFVRYRMSDTVIKIENEPCQACGRPYTPRLIELGGRSEDYLFSSENGWISPAILTYPFKELKTIQEIQLVQRRIDEVEVGYTLRIKADANLVKHDITQIQHGLHDLLGKEMIINFTLSDGFPRGPTGKFKWVVCELDEMPRTSNP